VLRIRPWPRGRIVVALAAAVLLVGVAASTAARVPVRVQVDANVPLDVRILVDGQGRALYRFTAEKRRSIRCVGGCARLWPPLIIPKGTRAQAGPGVAANRLGLVKRPDGRLQVTYEGFALYLYKGDRRGAVGGQGIGKAWYVVSPAGKLVKAAPASDDTGEDGPGGGDPPAAGEPETPPIPGY
jgi:predicted lipoprotein with Yx(FWY)xxD motif